MPEASALRQAGDPQGILTPEQGELSLHQGLWKSMGALQGRADRECTHSVVAGQDLPLCVWVLSVVLRCLMRMLVGWAV